MIEPDFCWNYHMCQVRVGSWEKENRKPEINITTFATANWTLPYIRVVHAWRSRWLAGQLPYLDQFSTELPAFNMLLLVVCSFTFPSSHFSPTGFLPNLLSATTSGRWASPSAASGKVTSSYLNPWLWGTNRHVDNINLPQQYHSPTHMHTLLQEPLVRNPTGKTSCTLQ